MVGFMPQRSLIVAVLRSAPDPDHSPIIDAVLRFDLDPDGGSHQRLMAAYAECVGQICATEGPTEVLAVIVDDRTHEPGRIRRQGTISTKPDQLLTQFPSSTKEYLGMAADTIITVIGNLVAFPELKYTPAGTPVANFTVASTPRRFDRASAQWKDGDPRG